MPLLVVQFIDVNCIVKKQRKNVDCISQHFFLIIQIFVTHVSHSISNLDSMCNNSEESALISLNWDDELICDNISVIVLKTQSIGNFARIE